MIEAYTKENTEGLNEEQIDELNYLWNSLYRTIDLKTDGGQAARRCLIEMYFLINELDE